MAFELGFGALYAPDLPVGARSELQGDVLNIIQEGLIGPAGNLRWGVNFGVTQEVDIRLGLGSFLGGAILSDDDVFFAYPHAAFHVGFGPGQIYRARIGVVTGALVFDLQNASPLLPPALFGAHGEVSPLVLQFGDYSQFEFSITQGLGVFVGDMNEPECPARGSLGGCISGDSLPGVEEPSMVQFGGHTMVAFGAVLE